MKPLLSKISHVHQQGGIREVWRRGLDKLKGPPSSWEAHMAKLVERDIVPSLPKVPPAGKRVLFWTPMGPWPHVLIEYLVGTALRLRGCEVKFAVCDGGLPHCEMERANFKRPACDTCWKQSQTIFGAFQLPTCRLSEHVTTEETAELVAKLAQLPFEALEDYRDGAYPAGRFARMYLTTYFQGSVLNPGERELAVMRRVLAGNILAYRYAERVQQKFRPEAVVMINGGLCQTEPAYVAFHNAGVRVATWDDYPPFQDSFIWSNEQIATYGYLDSRLWPTVRDTPLTKSQQAAVDQFLTEWAGGKHGDIHYHPNPSKSVEQLRARLKIDPSRRLFIAFTNVVWDSACLGRDVGFKGMMDWLVVLCEWFKAHPEQGQLLIRVHPAEKRLPKEYVTVVGVGQLLAQHYPHGLPANVILVQADDDAYSYSLAELAQGIGVYTTSLGYEFAARGRRVWVAGEVYYRGRGFTLDIEGPEHLHRLLAGAQWDSQLTPIEIEQTKRLIYARHFRQIVRIPYLGRTQTVYRTRPYFDNLRFLFPGQDPLINALTDCIASGSPIVDIPYATKAKWRDVPV